MQVFRQPLQARQLAQIHAPVSFRVVAHQNLAEGGAKGFDVLRKLLAVLEIELVLPASFSRASGDETLRSGVAKNIGAKLFVHENAGMGLGYTSSHGSLKSVVDHFLSVGDLCGLIRRQRAGPAEHLQLERAAVVERQNIKRLVIASWHGSIPGRGMRLRDQGLFFLATKESFF